MHVHALMPLLLVAPPDLSPQDEAPATDQQAEPEDGELVLNAFERVHERPTGITGPMTLEKPRPYGNKLLLRWGRSRSGSTRVGWHAPSAHDEDRRSPAAEPESTSSGTPQTSDRFHAVDRLSAYSFQRFPECAAIHSNRQLG